MDKVIWVEILSRQDVIARFRFEKDEIRIGRGYDNDVIVDDPYVSPSHLRITRSEAGLVADDAGTPNGTFVNGGKSKIGRLLLNGGEPIRIGRTFIRVRGGDFKVPAERIDVPSNGAGTLPLALLSGAGVIALEVMSSWFSEISEPKLSHYLTPLSNVALLALIWIGGWTVLCRIFSGQARFERNLLIGLAGLFSYSFYTELSQFAAYALTWRSAVSYDYIAMWSAIAAAAFFHLREIGPSGLRVKAVLTLVPNADHKQRLERDRLPLHQRGNFLLFLVHDGEQRNFLFTGVVAGHAVVFFFLLVDLLGDGQRINVDRDGVVEQAQIGETLDDAGIGGARPARERDDGMIMAVEIKSEI